MSYNEEQLKKTMAYILEFFRSEITQTKTPVVENNMSMFENHLKRIFLRELLQFKPDKYELKKIGSTEPYFIEWIDKNIFPFPDDFSITVTNDGNSFAINKGDKFTIFQSSPKTSSLNQDSKTNLTSLRTSSPLRDDSEIKSISSFKFANNQIAKNSTPEKKQEESEIKEIVTPNELIDYELRYESLYNYIIHTSKKSGKSKVVIEDSKLVDVNNIYGYHEQPKYDSETNGMFIPLYKKNKYGEPYRTIRAVVGPTIAPAASLNKHASIYKTDPLSIFNFEDELLLSNLNKMHIG